MGWGPARGTGTWLLYLPGYLMLSFLPMAIKILLWGHMRAHVVSQKSELCVSKFEQYQRLCERKSACQMLQWHGCMNHCCCTVYKTFFPGCYVLRRPGSYLNQYVVWLHRQGVLHIAGATHVRLGPSFEVWIQVSSFLKVKDQRFGSFATVFFFYFSLWSGSCVKTGYYGEIRWTVNRREEHLCLSVGLPKCESHCSSAPSS